MIEERPRVSATLDEHVDALRKLRIEKLRRDLVDAANRGERAECDAIDVEIDHLEGMAGR